jgi:O-acetyl-ADP-ribose deacetylase (regulator of RNase III)
MSLIERVGMWVGRGLEPARRTLVMADLVHQNTDAVVNAADSSLLGGTGVDGALHEAAGPGLAAAVRALGGCPMGHARITPGFDLPASYVIHTVAPVYANTGMVRHDRALATALGCCFTASVRLADRYGCSSIAFPALGAGGFGWRLCDVARIAADATDGLRFATLREIRFVVFGRRSLQAFETALGIQGSVEADLDSLRYHPGISASER